MARASLAAMCVLLSAHARADGLIAQITDPVFRNGGELAGAVTLTMPANRFRKSQIAPVVEAASALTAKLGGTLQVESPLK